MNTLLSLANGVLQYHRGKQTGLAGLAGIGIALFVILQWEHILPILHKLGIVEFFDNLGLIYEGEGGLTGYAIFMFIFKVCIIFVVAFSILLIIAAIISMVFSSNVGLIIAGAFAIVFMFPFLFLWMMYDHFTTPKEVREERIKVAREKNKPALEVMNDSFQRIDKESVVNYLNRIPTRGDNHFLIAVTENDEMYAVIPRPRYNSEYPSIKMKVERYNEKKHKVGISEHKPKQFRITYDHGNFDEKLQRDFLDYYSKKFTVDEVSYFLKPECEDFNAFFKWITLSLGYKNYVVNVTETYLRRKQGLLDSIAKAETKEEFDNFVHVVSEMDAVNEDIVKMMVENQKEQKWVSMN